MKGFNIDPENPNERNYRRKSNQESSPQAKKAKRTAGTIIASIVLGGLAVCGIMIVRDGKGGKE